jgi:ribonuclease J
MQVCIHRGTHEIGGSCVEVESQGKRIVLDIGLPLDGDVGEKPKPPVVADESLLGVMISHPHQDHYGLAETLPPDTPFFMGAAAHRILAAAAPFVRKAPTFRNVTHLQNRRAFELGPFRLTPYLVDHSAYDAYSILVEADDKRLFYTGDFRAHGYKGRFFESFVTDPPRGVDALLMEGTTLGRSSAEEDCQTEAQLVDKMAAIIKTIPGMVLLCCSGQNIDRIVTVMKAANKTRREFIIDGYTAHILRATERKTIPQVTWPRVRLFWPRYLVNYVKTIGRSDLTNDLKGRLILARQLAKQASSSILLFRQPMLSELESVKCLAEAGMIYSMWPGYLAADRAVRLRAELKRLGIPIHHCHTSGHASPADLQRFAKALAPGMLVPIHTSEPQRFKEFFGNVRVMHDNQWCEI